jgi:alpha-2-macroglobulin-like protein
LLAGLVQEISLTPPASADGVLIATVTDKAKGIPVAERLIFRQSEKGLHVNVKADKSSYVPADSATLTVTTTDDDGKPIGAMVGITVTDQSIVQMIEKRERAPRLGAMVMLESDVRELADADVYLDPTDAKGPLATDLLLGTQGWRRFATVDVAKFIAAQGDAGRRAMADLQPVVRDGSGAWGGFGGGGGMGRNRWAFAGEAEDKSMAEPVAAGEAMQVQDRLDELKNEKAPVDAPAKDFEIAADQSIAATQPMMAQQRMLMMRPMMQPVRIYAHDLAPGHQPGERNDFTETLYWCAGVKTAPTTGVGTVTFKLNDSVTSFVAMADGFTSDGRIGGGQTTISSAEPFYLEPKLPLVVTAGDVIHLPISFVNGTASEMKSVKVTINAPPGISLSPVDEFALGAGARERRSSNVIVGGPQRGADIVIHAEAGSYRDDVTRHMIVEPSGFPTAFSKGGLLGSNSTVSHELEIPATVVAGSVVTTAALYPTPMGNLTEALKRLMQEPNGCFEQTTSTNYPLVMADQYFLSHTGVDPAVISQTSDLLDKGYNRLIGFECAKKGFEWFGEDPGHECLSAYGLLQFTDMAKVRTVDQTMLDDTRNWLLARRDGNGGYTHERRSLHTWVTDPGCANGYCTWALLECGQTNLDKEVSWLKTRAISDPNSYVTALAANVMSLAGDKDAAKMFMDKLASGQDKDGHVLGAVTSVVASEGESLQIETTALATLAWLRDPAYAGNVEQAIHFLADSCEGGRYGSTQSTVLALRAIVAYDKARAHPTAAGSVQLIVDEKPVGGTLAFDEHSQGAIKLPDFADLMTPGKHTVGLKMTDGSSLPFALAVNFNSTIPASSDQCKLSIATKLKDAQVTEGAITEADVTVTNLTDQTVPTPIAIVGLPGGLEVRYDQLKELVKADRIAAYEVRGREVILYWRDMQARESAQIPLSVVAAVPGTYTGPASRAYLYYSDEFKQWSEGMKVRVDGK